MLNNQRLVPTGYDEHSRGSHGPNRNRWFSQRTKPPFILGIFPAAMLVITRWYIQNNRLWPANHQCHFDMWVCLKMGYIPNEIAIFHRDNDHENHWVQWGLAYFQTNPCVFLWANYILIVLSWWLYSYTMKNGGFSWWLYHEKWWFAQLVLSWSPRICTWRGWELLFLWIGSSLWALRSVPQVWPRAPGIPDQNWAAWQWDYGWIHSNIFLKGYNI